MESNEDNEADCHEELSGFDEPTISATVSYSLLNHEKELLLEKTKTQENEIMALRLKVESYEKEKLDAANNSSNNFTLEEKESFEREISVLRGKVALLERNNKIFSNQERKELKQDLERTKRRFKNLNEQLTAVRNSMEYDHINHVERALENFVKKVKSLEQENDDLKKKNVVEDHGLEGDETCRLIEEKEEIIKDQIVQIEELEHRIEYLISQFEERKIPDLVEKHDDGRVDDEVQSTRCQKAIIKKILRKLDSNRRMKYQRTEADLTSDSDIQAFDADIQVSDSDTRAVREMCGKMRKDIEEAKQKLKDMGDALESSQHAFPTHFPIHAYSSPSLGKDKKLSRISLDLFEKVDIVDPTVALKPSDTCRESIKYKSAIEKTSITVKDERMDPGVEREEVRRTSVSRTTRKSHKFLDLLHRYEFLRIRSFDHRLVEIEHECAREDYAKLLKQTGIVKNEALRKKRAVQKFALEEPPHERRDETNAVVRPVPLSNKLISSVRGREFYNITEDYGRLRSSPYRVYVAKAQYTSREASTGTRKAFSDVSLHIGDVVTSLGAPEAQHDGKTYQLVAVKDKIGLVPLSHLQLAEEIHDVGEYQRSYKGYLTSTLRRIPDLYKRLQHRQRIMHCGI